MSNTYTKIYIQTVFAVKNRNALIRKTWKERLHKYITGIIQNMGHKLIAVNSVHNHIHIFIGYKPHMAFSDIVRDVKSNSTLFINDEIRLPKKFYWQEGYGAFSYSEAQIDNVVKYILNQEEHHRTKTFREEYLSFLKEFRIEYDEKYLFDWIDDVQE